MTQNGRTYVTKLWRNDDNGNVEGGEDESLYLCDEERRNIKKSKWQMSEKRRDTATVHTKTAQAKCIKGYKTQKKNTANMHRQWKLTVNSQDRVAMTQPRYRTQTSYI